jgi:hypothetical protein
VIGGPHDVFAYRAGKVCSTIWRKVIPSGLWLTRRRSLRIVLTALILATAAAPAYAAYSGLTIIPTADLLGPGEACVDYQVDGPFPIGSGPEVVLLNTQWALGDRAEMGFDLDLSDDAAAGALLNGKVALRPLDTGLGVALGAYNVGEQLAPTTYIAATLERSPVRLHAGMQLTPEDPAQGFGGLDVAIDDRTQLWLEHLAGEENASAVSIAYQFHRHWGISLAWQHPNDNADTSYSIHVGCTAPAG